MTTDLPLRRACCLTALLLTSLPLLASAAVPPKPATAYPLPVIREAHAPFTLLAPFSLLS